MVKTTRITYNRRHCYNTKSNQIRKVKTPGTFNYNKSQYAIHSFTNRKRMQKGFITINKKSNSISTLQQGTKPIDYAYVMFQSMANPDNYVSVSIYSLSIAML